MKNLEKKAKQLKKFVNKSEKILLINHIKMDADAFGSLGALFLILEKIGKNVKAINDFETPEDFDFLLKKEIINKNLDLKDFSPDLIISLDAASESQLGESFEKNKDIFKKANFVVIDHHKTNSGFGDLNIIYPNYSSTCELLFDIFQKNGYKKYLDKKISTLLIAGIHTDTNIFYNQNTTENTLKVASKLVKLGADFRSPIYNFFHKISLKRLKLFGKAIGNLQKTKNEKLLLTFLENNDFKQTNATFEDTTGIINKLSNIEENEAICLIYEIENGTKVSFRSKNIDVGSFCASFENGGGHKNAAGFTLKENLEETKKIILEKFDTFFK